MTDAVIAAAVGSVAPTAAALLAYANARATRRQSQRDNLGGLAANVDGLGQSVQRLEAATCRIEASVSGLRERLAHVEGRIERGPHGSDGAARAAP